MKLFSRKKSRKRLVIRAEELRVDDMFVDDGGLVRVDMIRNSEKYDPRKIYVRLQTVSPLDHSGWGYRTTAIYREQFITISR